MNLDFTINKYRELCAAIEESGYKSIALEDYLTDDGNNNNKIIIMRHDVDSKIESALRMALIEKDHSVRSTYYFRDNAVEYPEILKSVERLGHEIGFHYEVMDKAKGDSVKAIELFKEELDRFRMITGIRTICMHGTPLSPYDNLSLWDDYSFKEMGIIGEGYLSIDFKKILYFSDTSRSWNNQKYKVKDVVSLIDPCQEKIKTTDDLIKLIRTGEKKQLYILTHPARWKETVADSLKDIAFQKVKNIAKGFLHMSFQKNRGR